MMASTQNSSGGGTNTLHKAQLITAIFLNGEELPLKATRLQCYEGDPKSLHIKHTVKTLATSNGTLGTMVFNQGEISDLGWEKVKGCSLIELTFKMDVVPFNSWPDLQEVVEGGTLRSLRKIAAAPAGSILVIRPHLFKGMEQFLADFKAGKASTRAYHYMIWAFEGAKHWGSFWRDASTKHLDAQFDQLEKATENGGRIVWSLLGLGKEKWAWLGHVELLKSGSSSPNLYAGQQFTISIDEGGLKGEWEVVVRGEGFNEYDFTRFDVRTVTEKPKPEFLRVPFGAIYKIVPKPNEKYSERIFRAINELQAIADPEKAASSPIDFSPVVGRSPPPPAPKTSIADFNPEQQAVLNDLNPFQRSAAIYALSVEGGLAYIQGPPGTGKSHTIQRIAKIELLKGCGITLKTQNQQLHRVIICGPSNASVDSVLHHFVKTGMEKRYNLLRVRSTATETDTTLPHYNLSLYKKMLDKDLDGEYKDLSNRFKDGLLEESERVIYHTSRSRLAAMVYREADVIFCTPQIAGQKHFRKRYCKATLLINDECAQMDEAHHAITMSLPSLERIINVGDIKQLPPIASEEVVQWGCSLAKRQIGNGAAENQLNRQYRMAPSISAFSNKMFYGGCIEDDVSVVDSPNNAWFRELNEKLFNICKNDLWIDSGEHNESEVNSSYKNEKEARLIQCAVQTLLQSGVSVQSIGIISAYTAQQDLLQEILRSIPGAAAQVHTVDAYQGSERDIIIISLVRSNAIGQKGFLRSEARLNVALTRAKHSRIIFGDLKMFLKRPTDMRFHVQHLYDLAQYHLDRVGRIVSS